MNWPMHIVHSWLNLFPITGVGGKIIRIFWLFALDLYIAYKTAIIIILNFMIT